MSAARAMPAIAVIGGGISGLVAARALSGSSAGDRVVLLEAADRLGGVIRTERVDDVVVEAGPDSFLARDRVAVDLCDELGLGGELTAPAVFGALVWTRGKLRRLPVGFPYGLPASPWAAWRAGILSAQGAARAAADLVLPGPLTGGDVAIGAFVRRRFGAETLERLVDPLLAGTRAGTADAISLAAATPQIDGLARRHRSLILGFRAARRDGAMDEGPPPFLTVRGGMSVVVDRLAADLRARRVAARTASRVERLEARGERDYELLLSDGARVSVAGVVIAVPAHAAAALVAGLSRAAADELAAIEYASVASATLVYPSGAGAAPPRASGILVPSAERRTLAACTWVSTKWPHLAPRDGRVVMRCFVGRTGRDPALELGDAALANRLAADLRDIAGLRAPPLASKVTRFERALPQYAVGHLQRIERIEAALAHCSGIALAGAGCRGSGLPDCIRQAQDAARRVLGALV